jgi:hypothetical protein
MNLRPLKLVFILALLALSTTASAAITLTNCRTATVTKNLPCEIMLTTTTNPINGYRDLSVTGTFTHVPTNRVYSVLGFYDGQSGGQAIYKIRFTPQFEGQWNYSTTPTPADAGLTVTPGSFMAQPSTQRGFLRRAEDTNFPEDPIFDNNQRIFLWGMTYYQIVTNSLATGPNGPWKTAVNTLLDTHSINKVRLLVFPWWDEFSGQFAGVYVDSVPFFQKGTCGGLPRTCLNHDSLRVDHFKALDDVVNHLHSRGIIAELLIFKDHAATSGGVAFDGKRTYGTTTAQDQRYTRYVLARYAAFPNVTWCLTNEYNAASMTLPKTPYWDTDIGKTVRSGDPYFVGPAPENRVRLSSIHAKSTPLFEFYANRATAFNDQWATHVVMQFHQGNGSPNPEQWGYDGVRGNLATNPNMPVANDEYGYILNVSAADARKAAWGVAVAGGYGTMGDRRPVPGTVTPSGQAETSMRGDYVPANSAAYNDIKNLIFFFSNTANDPTKVTNFYRMRYQDGVIASGARAIAGGEAAVQYVLYDADGNALTVNLPHPQNAAWTHYSVTPYNPVTGVFGAPVNVGFGNGIAIPAPPAAETAYLLKQAP